MRVDLDARYPVHLLLEGVASAHHRLKEHSRARVIRQISRFADYQGPGETPSVTVELTRAADIGVVLSVLYSPFDEIELTPPVPCHNSAGIGLRNAKRRAILSSGNRGTVALLRSALRDRIEREL